MALKKKVVMLQLPYQEIRSIPLWSNSPWGAAMLKAAALQEGLTDAFEIKIVPTALVNRAGDVMLLDYLEAEQPDILCATLYLWNASRTLYLAEELKKRLSDLIVIVGGPEVQESCAYIIDSPVVDYGCIGEGEELFVAIMHAIAAGTEPPLLPGLFFRREGKMQFTPGRGCVASLDLLPSPLQLGILRPANEPIVTYETMRGCPCSCSYCVTGTMSWRSFPLERVVADLEILHGLKVKKVRLSCSNFLLHPGFFDICDRLAVINADRSMELICFGYAEQITLEHAAALKSCNFIMLEIGLQTASARTLQLIRRPPLDEARFLAGLACLDAVEIHFSIDIIAGLPGEAAADLDNTIAFVKQNRLPLYNVFPLQLLPGSPLRNNAVEYGIEAYGEPTYAVIKTATLSQKQIRSYSALTAIVYNEICFNLVQEFQLPEFAKFNLSENTMMAASPTQLPITKILVAGATNLQRFGEAVAHQAGSSLIVSFTNLEQSLPSCVALIEAIWRKNPYCVIMPVFEARSAVEFAEVRKQCNQIARSTLVQKTVIKIEGLPIAPEDSDGFAIVDSFHIGTLGDLAKVKAADAATVLVELPPDLDISTLGRILNELLQTGKSIQYKNMSLYYLDNLIRQFQPGKTGSIHAPVDTGKIVTADANGEIHHHLALNNRMALEIAHMQLLFMRHLPEIMAN